MQVWPWLDITQKAFSLLELMEADAIKQLLRCEGNELFYSDIIIT